jgi:hypothetical protein
MSLKWFSETSPPIRQFLQCTEARLDEGAHAPSALRSYGRGNVGRRSRICFNR